MRECLVGVHQNGMGRELEYKTILNVYENCDFHCPGIRVKARLSAVLS